MSVEFMIIASSHAQEILLYNTKVRKVTYVNIKVKYKKACRTLVNLLIPARLRVVSFL